MITKKYSKILFLIALSDNFVYVSNNRFLLDHWVLEIIIFTSLSKCFLGSVNLDKENFDDDSASVSSQ
jgi:hypothetical protein